MAVLDEDFGADLTLVEDDGGVRSSPAAEPVRPPRDWQMLYEQAHARAERERVRADAAEARAEELRWAEVAARSDAGSWKSRFGSYRRRLSETNEEAKELRRAAKAAPFLRAEAVRLETLLSEAGNRSSETGAIEALGKEVARLREALAEPEAVEDPAGWRSGEAGRDPASREEAQRLFPRTLYGTSFWARFLFEHCACFRPVHRVAAWFSSQGLTVSPGTLADSLKRFVPLFEPVAHAILAHQNKAALRHADETGWRVQELRGEERSSRAWLWTSVSSDAVCFHIDPSRSAEAAHKLFGKALLGTVIVCDRYSAYKRLARLLGGLVTLAWCWSHMRRDFIDCAAGQVDLTDWCRGWIERIAGIYRLNEARLEHYDPGLKRPAPAFDAAQTALKEVLDALFAEAQRELAALPDEAREGKALRSLLNHRGGLSVFFDRPQVPMDNNKAERFLRGPSIGRRLSFGSDSEDGARFTAIMYSVVGTLSMNGIDVLRWLEAWLEACAKNGGQPPDDLSPWLPWSMSEERRRDFTAPG